MPKLAIVQKSDPSPQELRRLKIKAMPKPSGMLQCPRCGSRTVMTSKNGVTIANGRKQGGTVIHQDICADCHRNGEIVHVSVVLKKV